MEGSFKIKPTEVTMSQKDTVQLDQFLHNQSTGHLVGTIRPLDGNNDDIEVTPWDASYGFMCDASLVIPKDAIASVTPNGKTALCCTCDEFDVVDIVFQDGKSIAAVVILNRLAKKIIGLAQKTLALSSVSKSSTPRAPCPCACGYGGSNECINGWLYEHSFCRCSDTGNPAPGCQDEYTPLNIQCGSPVGDHQGDTNPGDHDDDGDHGVRRSRAQGLRTRYR